MGMWRPAGKTADASMMEEDSVVIRTARQKAEGWMWRPAGITIDISRSEKDDVSYDEVDNSIDGCGGGMARDTGVCIDNIIYSLY